MVEHAFGSQASSSAESTSSLPPLEELLREQPVSKSKQAASKQSDRGDDDTNKSSISVAGETSNGEDESAGFIPRLDSIAAAIFVPLTESSKLLSPPKFVPGSLEHHGAALNLIASHEASVRDNLQAHYQREILRIHLEAEALNPSFDYLTATTGVQAEHEAALRHDLDGMIANMREPDNPSADYNIKNVPFPNMDAPVTYALINSPRESAARDVMKVIAVAAREVSYFDNHVRSMSDAVKKQMQDSALRSQKQPDRMDID